MKTRIINFTIFEEQIKSVDKLKKVIHFSLDFADRRPMKKNLSSYHIESTYEPAEEASVLYTQKVFESIVSWLNVWDDLLSFENKKDCEKEIIEYLLRMQKSTSCLEIPKLAFKRIELPWK